MLVGVGARRVRSLFHRAKEAAPCIIFLDEIDAMGGKRHLIENRGRMTLNQLLVEMDGFEQNNGIIVVAATNMPEILDPALTRPGRFDRHVAINLPDVKARKDIIQMYLGDNQAPDVDIESLAKSTIGYSGADLFNMVNTAAIEATKKNLKKITMNAIENAKETVKMGPARKSLVITPETKRLTAFHEAGHAIVALHTKGADPVTSATLMPRGGALGYVSFSPKDELLRSKESMMASLDISMGGRAGEELIFGPDQVTQGAGSDFRKATSIAYAMVTAYGMGGKIGLLTLSKEQVKSTSPETKAMIESEVQEMLEQSYARAKAILIAEKKKHHLLANALLEHETLSKAEIDTVLNEEGITAVKNAKKVAEQALVENEKQYKILDTEPNLLKPAPSMQST